MARDILSILKEEKNMGISGGLYHKLQVDFAYNSNHIEGSRLSHEQTRYIFETHSIATDNTRVDDIIETVNHFKCFDYIIDSVDEPLSEAYIKKHHKMLKSGTMAETSPDAVVGDYKKYPNEVADMKTVHPDQVSTEIKALIDKYNAIRNVSLEDIVEFHVKFELIHPFYDGNGRVGRLLMFKECLNNGIIPVIINDHEKMFYYMGLKEWQENDKHQRLLEFFRLMQDDMKAILNYFEIPDEDPDIDDDIDL